MRSFFSSLLLLGTCLALGSGCSIVYNGSRFQGGAGGDGGGNDGGTDEDTGTEDDTGIPGDDADIDAAAGCTRDMDCDADEYCRASTCFPCDEDGDEFVAIGVPPLSCAGMRRGDCADDDDERFPGNTPICNNMIDEGCFDPTGLMIEGVSEYGFVEPFDIALRPPDAHLVGVEIFARSSDRAVVFTRLDETVRTPLAVEVDLAARDHMDMQLLNEWAGISPFSAAVGTGIYTSALRIGSEVRIGEIHVRSSTTMETQVLSFRGIDPPRGVASGAYDLMMLGAPGLEITDQPLLTQPTGGELFWAAPTNRPIPFYAIGTMPGATPVMNPIDGRTFTGTAPVWASSSERFGLITQRDNPSYFVWNGSTTEPTPPNTFWGTGSSGGVTGPGVVVTVDPRGGHGGPPLALVALPKRGLIELHLIECTFDTPAMCTDRANGSIAIPGMGDARAIALRMVSDTSVMFLVADSDAADGAHFGSVELWDEGRMTWAIPGMVNAIPMPVEGTGTLVSLSIDPAFTPDAVLPESGSANIAYAYIRQPSVAALPSHLSVAGLRVCINYPGF